MVKKELVNSSRQEDAALETVLQQLLTIRNEMLAGSARMGPRLQGIDALYQDSAQNLLHYLAFRSRDLRPLQLHLVALGLSSLGRAESHVFAMVDAVIKVIYRLMGKSFVSECEHPSIDFALGQRLLAEHTNSLLGNPPPERRVRIMVTMPSEAGNDYSLVHNLLDQGMDCMRINCAHDEPATWLRMIRYLRQAEQTLGRSCRILMDLAGPKLRTGPMEPGPAVVKIRPYRDIYGRVVAPARVWLSAGNAPRTAPSDADASLLLPTEYLGKLNVGAKIHFTDARGNKRELRVVDVNKLGCWAVTEKTAYIAPGTKFSCDRRGKKSHRCIAPVGELPRKRNGILLQQGDHLILTRQPIPGRSATTDAGGRVLTPAMISCTLPQVFDDIRTGESIWFDDGKIGGIVEWKEEDQVRIRIIRARPGGVRLFADKGINFPESTIRLSGLTADDVVNLPFISEHADIVGLSFANSADDVEMLQQKLADIGGRQPAIMLKIETRRGFNSLPTMLLKAMRNPCCGVMIARGDLAVECGFERLAEVQEEILWVCEAAHVPVIWATQVLETLAKEGIPSRAEITDAAMGHRAECVMLNKGPHVAMAVGVLDDILRRMQAHQTKKSAMLRELQLAHSLSCDERDT